MSIGTPTTRAARTGLAVILLVSCACQKQGPRTEEPGLTSAPCDAGKTEMTVVTFGSAAAAKVFTKPVKVTLHRQQGVPVNSCCGPDLHGQRLFPGCPTRLPIPFVARAGLDITGWQKGR